MFACHPCTRLFRPKRLFARYGSNLYPYQNVKAFPFGMSPSDAVLQMAPYVSTLLMFKQFIGSIGARFLPGLGFEPLRPTKILPIYFPAWVIDGELQASIIHNESQRTVLAQFINTYVPGNDFKVLSLISFWHQQLQHYQLLPFTSELERQYDTQVHCLPYTISPFSVLDVAKSWPHGDVEVEQGFRFAPTSIKPNLIAAYPILIPLYLAQYDTTLPGLDREVNLTVFMEGFSKKGRIFAEKYSEQFGAQIRELIPNAPRPFVRFTHLLDDVAVQPMRGGLRHFVRLAKMSIPQAPNMHLVLRKWLDDRLSTPSSLPSVLADVSCGGSTLHGEDERVRDFMDVADRSNVHMWLSLGSKLAATETVIETMKLATLSRNVHVVGPLKQASTEDVIDSTVKTLQEAVNDLTKQRQETLPTWWTEWERREYGLAPINNNLPHHVTTLSKNTLGNA